jgi:hypothetical protein
LAQPNSSKSNCSVDQSSFFLKTDEYQPDINLEKPKNGGFDSPEFQDAFRRIKFDGSENGQRMMTEVSPTNLNISKKKYLIPKLNLNAGTDNGC